MYIQARLVITRLALFVFFATGTGMTGKRLHTGQLVSLLSCSKKLYCDRDVILRLQDVSVFFAGGDFLHHIMLHFYGVSFKTFFSG